MTPVTRDDAPLSLIERAVVAVGRLLAGMAGLTTTLVAVRGSVEGCTVKFTGIAA